MFERFLNQYQGRKRLHQNSRQSLTGFTPLRDKLGILNFPLALNQDSKRLHQNSRQSLTGFTLIELLVVISIIGMLASVVMVSLNSARDKSRYARAIGDMKQIATASELDYNENNSFAVDVGPDSGSRLVPAFISQWPKPPCNGWTYDWDNWEAMAGSTSVRVTLRRADVNAVYYFCIKQGVDCSWGGGSDITRISPKVITCRE